MKLVDIIKKSRVLVNKLFNKSKAKFTKEDYFMLSVSLFVAKKESIIKKNNKNNTLYFDYKKNKKFYDKMVLFETIFSDKYYISADIPKLGKFILSNEGCFNGIENLVFPFNQRIEIENFEGTLDELNEVKRMIWIYSKIRDSFVHGDKYVFDTYNEKIVIFNDMQSDTMGSFQIDMILSPETLNFLSDVNFKTREEFKGVIDMESWKKYEQILMDTEFKTLEKVDKRILDELDKELDEIQNVEELLSILNIVKEYKKAYTKMNENQRRYYTEKIMQIIIAYARKNKINQEKTKELIEHLSGVLNTEENLYHLAIYSHMVFVFSNIGNVQTDNIRTFNLKIENDKYSQIIKKIVTNTNELLKKLTNPHIDKEKTKEYIVQNITHIIELIKIRNRWIINNIRNGIEHKNVNVKSSGIEIFNRKDNRNETEIDFMCTATYEELDELLKDIENPSQIDELDVNEFIEEIKNICGDGENIRKFSESLIIFENYISSKKQSEEDKPPKF